jgi:amidase
MLDAAAARIEAVEPRINALPIRFLDEARAQARAFRYETKDHPGWLAGLPVAVKDYNDVRGQLINQSDAIGSNLRTSYNAFGETATRTQTIMGGASHCDFRYRREG